MTDETYENEKRIDDEDYRKCCEDYERVRLFDEARTFAHDYLIHAITDVDVRFPTIDARERLQLIIAYMQTAANILHAAVIAQALVTPRTPRQSNGKPPPKAWARDAAKYFLEMLLRAGPVEAAELHAAARAEGISLNTLHRAKRQSRRQKSQQIQNFNDIVRARGTRVLGLTQFAMWTSMLPPALAADNSAIGEHTTLPRLAVASDDGQRPVAALAH